MVIMNINGQIWVQAQLTRYQRMVLAVKATIDRLMIKLQAKIQNDYLSGNPLHSRSGRLRGSVISHPAKVTGESVVGSVSSSGGPAWYGIVHELGGTTAYDIFPVNKKALAWPGGQAGDLTLKSGRVMTSKGILGLMRSTGSKTRIRGYKNWVKAGGSMTYVKHVLKHPPLPKRPFMAPAQAEMQPEIVAELQNTLNQEIEKSKS